jgi:hypothetical protein
MSEENRGDAINLFDFFNVLRRYKRLLIGLPILGGASAVLLVSLVIHPTWEASAVLEVGKVGPALVEPVTNVITRILLPSFSKWAINTTGIKSEEMVAMKDFYVTLKATQVKGSELIEIKLRGPSAEMAKNLLEGAIVNLQKMHTEIMAVTIERNKKQLQILTEDLQKTSVETDLLRRKLLASHNWNAFDATLSATLLKDKSTEIRDMIQRKLALEEQISPSRSYTTRVVDEIYISEKPVSPNKPLIVGLAILLGILGAVVLAFVHNAITKKAL